jgi:hypothetical protein
MSSAAKPFQAISSIVHRVVRLCGVRLLTGPKIMNRVSDKQIDSDVWIVRCAGC